MAKLVPQSEAAMQVTLWPHQFHAFIVQKNQRSDWRNVQTKLCGCIFFVIIVLAAIAGHDVPTAH